MLLQTAQESNKLITLKIRSERRRFRAALDDDFNRHNRIFDEGVEVRFVIGREVGGDKILII